MSLNKRKTPWDVLDSDIESIVVCAYEGGSLSIGYWGLFDPPTTLKLDPWPNLLDKNYAHCGSIRLVAHLLNGGKTKLVDPENQDGPWMMNLSKIKKGIRRAAEFRGMTVAAFIENQDSEDADIAVQFAVMGEIVYS